jgi:hypothetical protein
MYSYVLPVLARNVASVIHRRCACWVLVRRLRNRHPSEDLGVDIRIILKLIFKKCHGTHGLN